MNIVITISKDTDLFYFLNNSKTYNHKVDKLPKKANIGDKCYIIKNGRLICYMIIVGLDCGNNIDHPHCEIKLNPKQKVDKFIVDNSQYTVKGFRKFRYVGKFKDIQRAFSTPIVSGKLDL